MIPYALLDCRGDEVDDEPAMAGPTAVHRVGPRPGKQVDPLLAGRVVVRGEDADLAAVCVRLLRKGLLAEVEVGYLPATATPVTRLWALPTGAAAVEALGTAAAKPVVLVRDDVGGVLVGLGTLTPVVGTVYVDEHRMLLGPAAQVSVRPDPAKGLLVTVTGERRWRGLRRGRSTERPGRAVQIGTHAAPATVVRDGEPYRRPMETWIFYKHTEPLRLVAAGG